MITCNRCGSINPAGILNCQMCGTPLAAKIENELSPRMGMQGQPPLPAWLETLRAGERPSTNAPAGNSFSAADLLDEGTLPGWMRSGRTEAEENAPAALSDAFPSDPFAQNAPQVALRPSSQSSPNTGDDGMPPMGLAANSLIDEKSLPSWMQEKKSAQTEPQSGISAASLLQPDVLPEWMRNMQPQQSSSPVQEPPSFSQPASPMVQRSPSFSQSTPSAPVSATSSPKPEPSFSAPAQQGFSAGDLVDPSSLPSWMSQQGNKSNATPVSSAPSSAQPAQQGLSAGDLVDPSSLPAWMSQQGNKSNNAAAPSAPKSIQPGQTGFSAGDLVDPSSLPSWMSQQGNKSNAAPAPAAPSGVQPAPQGLSAGDLVDPSSLPAWMSQQGNKPNASVPGAPGSVQSGQTGLAASSLLDPESLPAWLQGQQNQQKPSSMGPASGNMSQAQNSWPPAPSPIQASSAPSLTGGLAASSFIDMNSLPEWMRAEGGAGQQSGPAGAARPGFAAPPRVENVRVPSRPRNEFAIGDTSEVAANVFASMLGVASSSPQISGSQPGNSPFPSQGGQYVSQQGGQYVPQQAPQGMQPPMAPPASGMNSGVYGQKPATPLGVASSPAPSAYGTPGGYPPGMQQGNTPNPYATGTPQNAAPFTSNTMNNRPGASSYGSVPYSGNVPGTGSPLPGAPGAAEAQKTAKPAKRGFFDALRDLFFH